MSDQQSSRSRQLFELGQTGVKSLIREPVRESVREALAEERIRDEEQVERTHRRITGEQTGDGNWFLRPAILLPILGLAAIGVILKRRRLTRMVEETSVVDENDETDSSFASKQRTAADWESEEVTDSGSHEDRDRDTDREELSRGE